MENKEKQTIDLNKVCVKLYKHKVIFFYVIPIIAILSYLYIICIPRYYNTETMLAPEVDNSSNSSSLGSLASSFGIDMSNIKSSDAITPLLYPDLMKDNKFIFDLFRPIFAVKTAVLNRLKNMLGADYFRLVQIGNRSCNFQNPVIRSF